MTSKLPDFSTIEPQMIEEKLKQLLSKQKDKISTLIETTQLPTWQNLMAPLEQLDAELQAFWNPISHLNHVKDSPELRENYALCLSHLSDFSTWLGHHQGLFQRLTELKSSSSFATLSPSQQTVIDNELRDFKLAGIALSSTDKARYAEISSRLSTLTTQFESNLIDVTDNWKYLVDQPDILEGLPERFITLCQEKAEREDQKGWLITLDAPSYLTVMQHAKNADLRQTLYQAYCTRASDQGPHDKQKDNTTIMHEIMSLRCELAELLGFNNPAEYSLATKMLNQTDEVLQFIEQLISASYPQAKREFENLKSYALNTLGLDTFNAWDVTYVSEQYRQQFYDLSDEAIRPYFPADRVVQGLFDIVEKLFQIKITEIKDFDSWHNDVRCFKVCDENNDLISHFYLDLYARNNKRGGAWMDEFSSRYRPENGDIIYPVTFITCNFMPPVGDTPALLSHDDVITLFHEFGHASQHMLTQVDDLGVSGLSGIPWDAVEVASQFLENYAWQKECLQAFAQHYETGETLPDALFEKMQKARCFLSAMAMLRQLEFSLFDFRLHMEFDSNKQQAIQECLDHVRSNTMLYPLPNYNRFQHGFSHIFAGGYAAGYYSYKWAEVMAADIFSLFEKNGYFDPDTAKRYRDTFLALGGSVAPEKVFQRMCDRAPDIKALLAQSGITFDTV